MSKSIILGIPLSELKEKVSALGIKPFVAKQIMDWVYRKHVVSFDAMSNISKSNQVLLDEHFQILPFKCDQVLDSGEGFARKYIFSFPDGNKIESVVLAEKTYNTLCVSSQCGCPVDCKFCLTGVAGFKRQLTAAEIIAQVVYANSDGHPITNLVFMGMGEPMLNYDAVFSAIDFMCSEDVFGMSRRRVTVSTSGYIQNIKRLIEEENFINLAFSVGSAIPEKRAKIMPIENRNPIMEVAKLLHQYLKLHNRKLTLEYTLLDGINDTEEDAKALSNLSKFLNAKVNLINLNPHAKIPFSPVSVNKLHWFRDLIKDQQLPVTIRFRKGQDISAACGQLGESCL